MVPRNKVDREKESMSQKRQIQIRHIDTKRESVRNRLR